MIRLQNAFLAQEIIDIKDQVNFRDGQKLEFFQNPGFGFNPGFKMKNPGFSG